MSYHENSSVQVLSTLNHYFTDGPLQHIKLLVVSKQTLPPALVSHIFPEAIYNDQSSCWHLKANVALMLYSTPMWNSQPEPQQLGSASPGLPHTTQAFGNALILSVPVRQFTSIELYMTWKGLLDQDLILPETGWDIPRWPTVCLLGWVSYFNFQKLL